MKFATGAVMHASVLTAQVGCVAGHPCQGAIRPTSIFRIPAVSRRAQESECSERERMGWNQSGVE